MSLLAVNDVYASLQGEGTNTGLPMVLVRLQGCSVGCVWCDQKETWRQDAGQLGIRLSDVLGPNCAWAWVEPKAIRDHIRQKHPGYRWVLLTGGEPCEQDIAPFVDICREAGWRVALETSGTAPVPVGIDWVCVSPKLGNPAGKPILPEAIARADELKFVITGEKAIDVVQRFVAAHCADGTNERVLLQPVSNSPKVTALCIEACQQFGWRLSVQLHKYLGVA
jgi:7-carboxy-7-deazaguanine synthase